MNSFFPVLIVGALISIDKTSDIELILCKILIYSVFIFALSQIQYLFLYL